MLRYTHVVTARFTKSARLDLRERRTKVQCLKIYFYPLCFPYG